MSDIHLAPNPTFPLWLPVVAWNPWTDIREREDVKELNITFPFGPVPPSFQVLFALSSLWSSPFIYCVLLPSFTVFFALPLLFTVPPSFQVLFALSSLWSSPFVSFYMFFFLYHVLLLSVVFALPLLCSSPFLYCVLRPSCTVFFSLPLLRSSFFINCVLRASFTVFFALSLLCSLPCLHCVLRPFFTVFCLPFSVFFCPLHPFLQVNSLFSVNVFFFPVVFAADDATKLLCGY